MPLENLRSTRRKVAVSDRHLFIKWFREVDISFGIRGNYYSKDVLQLSLLTSLLTWWNRKNSRGALATDSSVYAIDAGETVQSEKFRPKNICGIRLAHSQLIKRCYQLIRITFALRKSSSICIPRCTLTYSRVAT